MHNQEYLGVMVRLGLSTHNRQFERRKEKYPTHFKQKRDGKWYITPSLAYYLQDCKDLQHACIKLKGGRNEN